MNLRHPRHPRLKKIRKTGRFDFYPPLFLPFWSLSGLFLVSWSLSGLFQGLSGNKETEAVRRLRIGPE